MRGPATPSGNPATLTPSHVRVWYGDGTIETFRANQPTKWRQSKSDDVQVVIVYYAETYQSWNHYTQAWRTLPYRRIYDSSDYYWIGADGLYSGNAGEIPQSLPNGSVKSGKLIDDTTWWTLYNAAVDDMVGS